MSDPLNAGIAIQNKDGLSISIFLPYKAYCEIEELCQRQGITFDRYFLQLHQNKNKSLYIESSGKNCSLQPTEIEDLKEKVEKKLKKK